MAEKKFVVAYDGSAHAKKALEWAVDLAQKLSAEIFIVTVSERTLHHLEESYHLIELEKQYHQKFVEEAEEGKTLCEKQGVVAHADVLEGHPADEVIKYARKQKADLIVSGTRGLGGFGQLLLGSVAHKLVTYSDTPVVIVK
ncbi:MAG TPA: universal stress protein [Patescibacteria group bacterium]|nr:universal stress protein [Patescibacteria group bacterium]